MNRREIVLNFIQRNGPSVPGQVYKELGMDTLLTSAFMSELVINNDLKVSSVKFGGSPLYYIVGQEAQLEKYVEILHEKERKAVQMLKERLVLRDVKLEPVIRVALRNAKDYAKPLFVTLAGQKEIFWKWYLLKDSEEIKKKVHSLLDLKKKKKEIKKEKKTKPKISKPQSKKPEKQECLVVPEKEIEKSIEKLRKQKLNS